LLLVRPQLVFDLSDFFFTHTPESWTLSVSLDTPKYSIARDYDPGQEILSAESDPMAAYLTYLADVTGGAVGNMGFTVADFREHINGLKQRR
jgi:hypothetical protein